MKKSMLASRTYLTINQPQKSFWLFNPFVRVYRAVCEMIARQVKTQQNLELIQHVDRIGQVYWEVYNPQTQQTLNFNSEKEIRGWLENSHNLVASS